MPVVKSFAGGEVTPEMFGRFDLAKQQVGLALCSNFWILPHGVAQNRAGFEFVNEVKDSTRKTRIVEFSYNTEQTYVIEVGHLYFRFHTGGATLVESPVAITNVTQGVPGIVSAAGHTYANGDWLFLSGIGGMTALNGRFVKADSVVAGVSFGIKDLRGANIDTTGYPAYTAGGTANRVLEVVTPYVEADLFQLEITQSNDVLTLTHPNYPPAELRRISPTVWQYTVITFLPTLATPGPVALASFSPLGSNPNPISHFYVCTGVADETLEESLPSTPNSIAFDLAIAGNIVTITVPVLAGAVRMNVYKLRNGLYSFIAQTASGGVVTDNNIAPDASKTAPFLTAPFTGANNFPGAVGYFEGRRVFAGTNNRPQTYWMTASGSESNLCYSIPTRDDDAITGRLVAQQANRIRHIAPLSQLVMLTSGGEWKFSPVNSDILTPDSAFPKQDSTEGAALVKAIMAGGGTVFVQEAGERLNYMAYKWQSNGWSVEDLSIMAPHLFDNFSIVDLAYQKKPFRIIWAARNDGALLGITFHPEHEIMAWHHHHTDGAFESTACAKEGGEYPLYVVVKRNINGVDVRYIERLHTRRLTALEDAFFVDAGITYDGSPTNVVSGLWHLVGELVTILVDGSVHPSRTVTAAGTLTLDQFVTGSLIHIGKSYTADLQTVPTAMEGLPALGTAFMKNATGVYLRVDKSSGLFAGPTFSTMHEYPPRANEAYGDPPSLKSQLLEIPIEPDWNMLGQVCVRQAQPLPTTILGMVIDFASEGAA